MWVSDPGVENPAGMRGPVLQVVVDATGHHLLAEADHVRAEAQLGVAPHRARSSPSRLHLLSIKFTKTPGQINIINSF